MHMADALLSPAVGGAFWAGTAGAIGYASKKLSADIDDRTVPLMGVLGAFIFAVQMITFTIPGTGSSGHLGGGMVLAVLLGPFAAFLVMASVLTVQALFFADGGLLALGCNIWNLGIYPCFVAYPLVYRPLAGDGRQGRRGLFAALAGSVAGLQLGAFSVVLQTLLSGKSELPFGTFALFMQPVHLVIGVVEGIVTAGVIGRVLAARPELLANGAGARPATAGTPPGNVLAAFVVLAVVIGGALSWFASTRPDGLEWSIAKVTGRDALPAQEQGIERALRDAQERTAVLPDYGFRHDRRHGQSGEGAAAWPRVEAGTSVSGVVGAAIVLAVSLLAGLGIRAMRKRSP